MRIRHKVVGREYETTQFGCEECAVETDVQGMDGWLLRYSTRTHTGRFFCPKCQSKEKKGAAE
jgi:hypothetical protein